MYGLELGEYMKILFISLGCDKNLVDSEQMMGLLRDRDMNSRTMKKQLMWL